MKFATPVPYVHSVPLANSILGLEAEVRVRYELNLEYIAPVHLAAGKSRHRSLGKT